MKKLLSVILAGTIISASSTGHAMYPITEWMSFVEKTLQDVTDAVAKIDFEEMLQMKEQKRKQQDPKADGTPKVSENKSSVPQSEFPPYATSELQKELTKEEPGIPEVEVLVRDSLAFKSETIERGNLTERTAEGKQVKADKAETESNSLEKQQAQALIVYINARALARRTLDKRAQAETDSQDMKNEQDSKTSTGSLQKTAAASIMYRTHVLLNEIAVLRNSYLELTAIDAMPATEAAKDTSAAGQLGNLAKGALGH